MAEGLVGYSKDNWRANTNTVCSISNFIMSKVQRKNTSLICPNEAVCWCCGYYFYDVLLESNEKSTAGCMKTRAFGWASKENIIPLPYLPQRKDTMLDKKFLLKQEWYFPVSLVKEELCDAVFQKDTWKINYIISKDYSQYRNNKYIPNPLIAFTAHSPNSVAFSVFLRGSWEIINFALTTFQINSSLLNRLRLGVGARHPTEILARRGEFKILGELIANHGLAFKGQRIDSGLKYYISFNHILSALETGDIVILQQAIQFSCRGLTWMWKDLAREDGATPLQLALSEGRVDLIETLLIGKAPVNELGWCDFTSLQFAVDLKSSEQIITLLLRHKAAVNGNIAVKQITHRK